MESNQTGFFYNFKVNKNRNLECFDLKNFVEETRKTNNKTQMVIFKSLNN